MYLIAFIILLVCTEVVLILVVNKYRRDFQWLITEKDERPALDQAGLEKFFKSGYDPYLGWSRKANSKGLEKGVNGSIEFNIGHNGERVNPIMTDKQLTETIAVFGDSYVFCRQVNDAETWPVYLTQKLETGISNYGVGNYGIDQAVLRYEQTILPESVNTVILGFVPETICRIHCYWKHYLEFGNTFAFKPRFILDGKDIKLLQNPMQKHEDFSNYQSRLKFIQENDYFYQRKFRSYQFRFPYILSFFRNFRRNSELLAKLTKKKANKVSANEAFAVVMKGNIEDAHKMYADASAVDLLRKIILRFKSEAESRGHKPIILVMPQLIDIKLIQEKGGKIPYGEFFHQLKQNMTVIDLTEEFLKERKIKEYFTEDLYGGHFSTLGNQRISDILSEHIKVRNEKPIAELYQTLNGKKT